ncbi:bifunctional 2-C-methyl-D-erythritol 4-phosphate cytidylyltransferase/2-C-methyl-D-erythritol 2,4-cyclodiphosphate synthase [Phenylobacterium sp.]|jgi:2-C-methyl-D-erythritol 4-phosphate cytidylyltransferase/2-C-methyl-D-erythritol 2,4-cyclodiphosphate synthase|uniref:bifunctional 2-C-methyl-D-erythritol 4-phosphate cytidylyltransferase/2-C-methyl-D-erythritol 2,4-cyclodiphosphate synthase n=1 Tax=Phenylobacterium sp. TaxID=1871053 RepID=UPI002E37075D|nr:bifunctional 2-C-methyl-D-erythritol 4-phosphate cytidylyltransferase/2-C-methyl-D-erythritol 2,4-cyclodiphosphate synthase [Phenylobacterium sp.]HEX2560093.1 bifunctional 2-C-methyl-D-erythritol 4-phosphate cytidylyltransferase/2-C-methyl-D-erythritol 2,4-cyclodiphosphate synthase [Phenylobacterium sp.]
MSFTGLIVAAGSGLRAGPGGPKTLRSVAGRPVLRWSAEALLAAGARELVVAVSDETREAAKMALSGLPRWRTVLGGATRALSVQAGLAAIDAPDTEPVLIHDAARPFLETRHMEALLASLQAADGAVPALPVADTLKRAKGGAVQATVSRDGLFRAQTPQAFRLGAIRRAYGAWSGPDEPTDDAAVVERAGGRIALTAGDPRLMKLTYPEDFAMAEQLAGAARIVRVGQGIDAHRFGPGDRVWLCGVEIPHDQGLVGHSDADAGLHALTDALLGAVGDGDIGQHFPPSDPQWRGAASDRFLRHAADRITAGGGRILAVDVTLVCERPRIGPHRDEMRARIAQILELPLARVSVKATTTEGMGFTGRGEGLLAQAVATVETPL